MTNELLEQRLRRWYRDEVDTESALPQGLRSAVLDIPAVAAPAAGHRFRSWMLLAAAAIVTVAAVSAILVGGSQIIRMRPLPTALPSAIVPATPTPTPTPTPSPTPTPRPSPTATASPAPAALIAVYHALGDNPGDTAEVFTLDPATGARVPLGSVPIGSVQLGENVFADTIAGVFGNIEWSTDRRLITISSVGGGFSPRAQFDVVAGTEHDIFNHLGEAYVSPDGTMIASVGTLGERDNAPQAIIVADLDGNILHQIQLPAGGVYFTRFAWSPDSSAIVLSGDLPAAPSADRGTGGAQVFAATLSGPGWVFVVPINGDPIQQVGGLADQSFGLAQISPDMSTIVATLSCQAPCVSGLVKIDVASGVITPLTTNPNDLYAQWSPDGSRIAFSRTNGLGRGIWIINADGSNLTRLTTADRPNRDHDQAWSPDGSSLIFSRGDTTQNGLGDLYVISAAGGDPQLLLTDAVGDW